MELCNCFVQSCISGRGSRWRKRRRWFRSSRVDSR